MRSFLLLAFLSCAAQLAAPVSLGGEAPGPLERNVKISAGAVPLPRAHAHNDYRHQRPLLDALACGFCSVEADIFLVDGRLLVGHGRDELRPERTLESLYLDPLRERARKNGGRVYRGGPSLTLLVDIKSDGETTYAALDSVLARYADVLTHLEDGQLKAGAVTVIISGNRATESIAADTSRYCGIDGRLADLPSDAAGHLLPLISDNWRNHFDWRGEGPMPAAEKEKLRGIVAAAHREGRRIRLWATPDNAALWSTLYEAGVDLINTDDLEGLQQFLLRKAGE